MAIGGHAWETTGQIWYAALLASNQNTGFQAFADHTHRAAADYGPEVQAAVADAWRQVGVRVSGVLASGARGMRSQAVAGDQVAQLTKTIEALSERVKTLSKEMKPRK